MNKKPLPLGAQPLAFAKITVKTLAVKTGVQAGPIDFGKHKHTRGNLCRRTKQ